MGPMDEYTPLARWLILLLTIAALLLAAGGYAYLKRLSNPSAPPAPATIPASSTNP